MAESRFMTVTVAVEDYEAINALIINKETGETLADSGDHFDVRLSATGQEPSTHLVCGGYWLQHEIEAILNCMIESVYITLGMFVEGDLKFIPPTEQKVSL